MSSYHANIDKKILQTVIKELVKASTIELVPECLFVLFVKPLVEGIEAALMLVHLSISIENPLPPVGRIVPFQASFSCIFDVAHACLSIQIQFPSADRIVPL